MTIPWKLRKLLIAILGEDRVNNRKVFTPDFSAKLFTPDLTSGVPHSSPTVSVVDIFLNQVRPRFFVNCEHVVPLVETIQRDYPEWESSIVAAAKAICDDGLPIYHLRGSSLGAQFPWSELKRGPYEDQLFISRPQRFGFAPVLAQAALFDRTFLQSLDDALAGWQRYAQATPYRWPYNSNHAVVYRVIALCWCWLFVAALHRRQPDSISNSVLYSILAILKNDILYLGPNLGKSHPNNHLLADYFVGWLLHYMFPDLIPDAMDFSGYEAKWQAELRQQFYSDGGSFEHAVHYHEHGCEMLMIYRLLVDKQSISADLDQHIGRILRFQARLNGPLCRPWPLGDTTEDTLLPLDDSLGWSSRAILAVHNYLYHDQSLPVAGALLDQKAFWLLAGEPPAEANVAAEKSTMESYPEGGFVYWRNCINDSELVLRTGVSPESHFIQGHMHSDILSLYWRVGEVDLLASSGTYSYKYKLEEGGNYRDYFCGPFSHSAVVIDDADPLGKLEHGFRRGDNGLRVSYQIYGDPSIVSLGLGEVHCDNCYNGFRRAVLQLPDGDRIVLDIFTEAQRALRVSTGWQFDQNVGVICEGGALHLSSGGQVIARIISQPETAAFLHKGELTPILGWQSASYGVKSPTYYASYQYPRGLPWGVFALTSRSGSVELELDAALSCNESVVVTLRYDSGRDVVFLNFVENGYACNIDGINLVCRAAVHSQRHGDSDRIVAIDCTLYERGGQVGGCYSPGDNLVLEKKKNSNHWAVV